MTTYRCHRYFPNTANVVLRLVGFLVALVWALPVASYFSLEPGPVVSLRLSVYLSFTIAMFGWFSLLVNREIEHLAYHLDEESLVRSSRTAVRTVRLSEVTSFRFVRVPFLAAFGEIRASSVSIRIPLIVEGLPSLIEGLAERLDAAGRASVFQPDNIGCFVVAARVNELSTQRLKRVAGMLPSAMGVFFGLSGVAGHFYWGFPPFLTLGWALLSTVVPVAACVVYDLAVSSGVRRTLALDPGATPKSDTAGAFATAAVAVVSCYLLLGIFMRHLYRTLAS